MSRSFNGMGLLIAVSLAVACQAKPKEEPARGIPVELDPAELLSADTRPIELTSSNFKVFAWRAMNELRAQTEKNVAWGIDKSEWSVDQDTGKTVAELVDPNGGAVGKIQQFWNHVNGIDYNADLDQIMISVRGNSELLVLDHSTTTAESRSHAGGRQGKGGRTFLASPLTAAAAAVTGQISDPRRLTIL